MSKSGTADPQDVGQEQVHEPAGPSYEDSQSLWLQSTNSISSNSFEFNSSQTSSSTTATGSTIVRTHVAYPNAAQSASRGKARPEERKFGTPIDGQPVRTPPKKQAKPKKNAPWTSEEIQKLELAVKMVEIRGENLLDSVRFIYEKVKTHSEEECKRICKEYGDRHPMTRKELMILQEAMDNCTTKTGPRRIQYTKMRREYYPNRPVSFLKAFVQNSKKEEKKEMKNEIKKQADEIKRQNKAAVALKNVKPIVKQKNVKNASAQENIENTPYEQENVENLGYPHTWVSSTNLASVVKQLNVGYGSHTQPDPQHECSRHNGYSSSPLSSEASVVEQPNVGYGSHTQPYEHYYPSAPSYNAYPSSPFPQDDVQNLVYAQWPSTPPRTRVSSKNLASVEQPNNRYGSHAQHYTHDYPSAPSSPYNAYPWSPANWDLIGKDELMEGCPFKTSF